MEGFLYTVLAAALSGFCFLIYKHPKIAIDLINTTKVFVWIIFVGGALFLFGTILGMDQAKRAVLSNYDLNNSLDSFLTTKPFRHSIDTTRLIRTFDDSHMDAQIKIREIAYNAYRKTRQI